MVYLPLAFFIPPTQFLVHAQLNLLYQFWIHTEVTKSRNCSLPHIHVVTLHMYCSSCTNWGLWSGSWTLQATTASTTVATATASTRTTRECSSSGTGSSVGFQFKFRNFYSEVLQQCLNVVGTFEAERDDQEIAYGLVHPINNWNPLYTQVFSILSYRSFTLRLLSNHQSVLLHVHVYVLHGG